ncbi:ATP-binding protein [Neptunomonas sp.]|uniref:sensor histidine kinase n=1 Tax=Neptunomonas sp. TaxID=1971898 RepID=UPI003566CC0C
MRKERAISLSIVALLCSLILSWQSYVYTRDWGLVEVHQQGSVRLLDTISALRNAIDQYRYLPFLLSQSRDVKDMLVQPNPDKIIRVSRYLEQTNLVAGSAALLVLDLAGRVVAYSNWRDQDTKAARIYQDAPFFTQAISGEQGRHFMLDGAPLRPSYYLSAPIYHREMLIGVSVMRLDISKINELLSADYSFYVSGQGDQLLFASQLLAQGSDDFWPLTPLHSEILNDGRDIQLWKHASGVKLNMAVKLDDLGWSVGTLNPIEAAEQRASYVGFTVAGGCLALALLVLYLREFRLKRRSQLDVIRAQRDSEQRQRYIINTAQVGLITVDKRGSIIFINPMVMQQFGVSLALIIGQPLHILFTDIEQFKPLKRWLDALTQGAFTPITGYEVVGKRSDGSMFPLLFSIRMMTAVPEPSYLVTVIDITRRKRLEHTLREVNESLEHKVAKRTKALQAAQSELVQAEKLAALGRMSTAIVHELNQPLTAMRNYLAIVKRIKEQPALLDENLDLLNGLVDRMALITGQLKSFAYKNPDKRGTAELISAIRRVLKHYEFLFSEQRINCNFECDLDVCWVQADEVRLEQVLINLIKNASDAIPLSASGGGVYLRLSCSEGAAILEVQDSGEGATDDQLLHMFEPFYTSKKMGDGLGLGLSIVDSIIRDVGGNIQVSRNHTQGLCFTVSLPLVVNSKEDFLIG